MFENILGQRVTETLANDVLQNCVPPALLLSGADYSGKLSTALELARVMCCSDNADWNCTCESCKTHRELFSRDMLLLGSRDHPIEIRASAAAFQSTPSHATFYLFLRSVRKLTARFNSFLWDDDDPRLAKSVSMIEELEERLSNVRKAFEQNGDATKDIEKIIAVSEKLQHDCMYDQILIAHVRNLSSWLRFKPSGEKKIVIIDNADKMHESARNAFLKILEEPPEYAHFILSTSRRRAILPTILSRVRSYNFEKRKAEHEAEVIRRVFRGTPAPNSDTHLISAYLYTFLTVPLADIEKAAALFVKNVLHLIDEESNIVPPALFAVIKQKGLLETGEIPVKALVKMLDGASSRTVFSLFLQKIVLIFRSALRNEECTPSETAHYAKISSLVSECYRSVTVLNSSVQAALENLLIQMKECLCGNL